MAFFGKQKPEQKSTEKAARSERVQATTFFIPSRTHTEAEFLEARDKLQIADVEREIMTYALDKVQEAEGKKHLSPTIKERLSQRYQSELARVNSDSETYQRIVDLYELETARETLLKDFTDQLKDLNSKIGQLNPSPAPKVASVPARR